MRKLMTGLLIMWAAGLAGAEPVPAGKWLVDLGRDYPLTPQAGASDIDAEITLLLMQAAARVEPELAEAYRWQVDLFQALGREKAAGDALDIYCRLVPDDLPARLAWVDLKINALQTAEEREAFCRKGLERKDLPAEVASALHQRLVGYYWNRGQNERALEQARLALEKDPYNLAALRLLDKIDSGGQATTRKLVAVLKQLALSPGDWMAAKAAGDDFIMAGMAAEADRFYRHALAVYALIDPNEVPAALLRARASALLAMGRADEALPLVQDALRSEPNSVDALLLRARVAELAGDEEAARAYYGRSGQLCEAMLGDEQAPAPAATKAGVAWVYAHYLDRAEEADPLAREVLAEDANSVLAGRALGATLRQANRLAEAREILAPLADKDVWSAVELARVLEAQGQREEAGRRIQRLTTQPAGAEERGEIASLADAWKIKPATTQPVDRGLLASELRTVSDDLLDYPLHPEKYLAITLDMGGRDLPVDQSWRCAVELTNKGSFAITIGPGMMIEPDLLCVVTARGDRVRSSGGTLRIPLNSRLQLGPGESLKLSETLKIGLIRAGMLGTPQMSHEVEVVGITNPAGYVGPDGGELWVPGVGGRHIGPVAFRRLPAKVDPASMRTLLNRTRAGRAEDRIEALELLAMLLAEHQHLAAGRLKYVARPIDAGMVQAAVLARATDADWRVRARLAECMRWFVLDASAKQTGAALLGDSHWLVRGLARRMLADQHGQTFEPVLQQSAEQDPDKWVRQLSKALLGRLALRSQPAN